MSRGGPLAGRRAIVTRPIAQAPAFSRLLEGSGARVIEVPTIEIVDPPDWGPADRALDTLESYDIVVFTSANGVRRLAARMARRGLEVARLAPLRLMAIGPMTAQALAESGLPVGAVPGEYRAEALVDAVSCSVGTGIDGARILLPRALEAREVLPQGLRDLGATVDVVPVYQAVIPAGARERARAALEERIDLVTFTSSSTVRNFMRLDAPGRMAARLKGVAVGCIGPITAETAGKLGLSVAIQPDDYTVEGLHRAVLEYFAAIS